MFLKVGEIGKITSVGDPEYKIQSEKPSYGSGDWFIDGYKLELVEEKKFDTKFQIGDKVRVLKAYNSDNCEVGDIGVVEGVDVTTNTKHPFYNIVVDGAKSYMREIELQLYKEDVESEVITEAIRELKGETAFGDVVISATYSIEVKGVTLVEGLKFEQMYELREALNKIVKL